MTGRQALEGDEEGPNCSERLGLFFRALICPVLRHPENHQPGLADENPDDQIWTGGFHEPAEGYVISLGLGNIHVVGGSLITPYAARVSNC